MTQTLPLKENLHPFEPEDWIWIKSFTQKSSLQPKWKGPFQILLRTQTAIKVAEKDTWIHWTHIKPADIEHRAKPTLTTKVSPIRLKKDPETDKWALKTRTMGKTVGEGESLS